MNHVNTSHSRLVVHQLVRHESPLEVGLLLAPQAVGAAVADPSSGSRSGRPHATPLVADAFAASFWVAVGLIAAALVPALLLPSLRSRQERPASPSRARELPA